VEFIMEAVPPVNLQDITQGSASNAPGTMDVANISSELKLGDYAAQLEVNGVHKSVSTQFADPSAIADGITNALQGYLDRTKQLTQMTQKPTSPGEPALQSGAQSETTLPRGPAAQELQAPSSADSETTSVNSMHKHTLDALAKMLEFGMETAFVSTSVNNLTTSANKLLRGQ
jgi:hypothetical protein